MNVPSLSRTIFETLRDEIANGVYGIGALLPDLDSLRRRFGSGEYAVRRALRRLRNEGLVTIRRHVGVIVNDKALGAWKGRIAFIAVRMTGSFLAQMLELRFARRFAAEGYSIVPLFLDFGEDGTLDIGNLARHLANGFSFAICYCINGQVTGLLDRANVPYVVLNRSAREFPRARGVFRENFRRAYADLIKAMHKAGVRRILEVDMERSIDRGFKNQLFEAGIAMQRIMCATDVDDRPHISSVKNCGHSAVADYFADPRHRAHPPDAVLFDDDYLAVGGIVAILEAGLRIPDDIKVVPFANRGNEPVLGVSLARIENDPETYGNAVADYVLANLAGRKVKPPQIEYRFVPGESLGRGLPRPK